MTAPRGDTAFVRLEGLARRFGAHAAVDAVSFAAVFFLAGENRGSSG